MERIRNPLALGSGAFSLGRHVAPSHTHVVLPPGWADVSATWSGTLTPPRSGLYTFSLQGVGAATLTLDGVAAVSDPLSHGLGTVVPDRVADRGPPYRLELSWEPIDNPTPSGEATVVPSSLTLGWSYDSARIAAAVAAARRAQIAVVFAGSFSSEAFDRPSLTLPGDENALISAVAAANPRTVVVLNTGGPVLDALAAAGQGRHRGVVSGRGGRRRHRRSPLRGRRPLRPPPRDLPGVRPETGIDTAAQWPGVDLTSTYSEGLEVGYRYDHATGTQPLFPFGYGLAYTRFSLSHLTLTRSHGGFSPVRVTNTGTRAGVAVPEAYLTYPPAAGEPPAQLAAFAPVALGPRRSRAVTLEVPSSSFRAYLDGGWTTVPGTYTLSVGQSSSDLPLSVSVRSP